MKSFHWVFSLILTLGLSGTLLAQNTAPSQNGNDSIQLEEILVTGTQSYLQLRSSVEYAKLALFDSYNDLNVDNYYDIECRNEVATMSHISERVCEPRFVQELTWAANQDFIDGFGNVAQLEDMIREAELELVANMVALSEEHPELLTKTREYMQLSDEYEQLKDEHCEGKFFCSLHTAVGQ